jgi:hypothetical protein
MNPGSWCHADMQCEEQAHTAETEDLGTKRVYELFALSPLSWWCEWQLKALICAKCLTLVEHFLAPIDQLHRTPNAM